MPLKNVEEYITTHKHLPELILQMNYQKRS